MSQRRVAMAEVSKRPFWSPPDFAQEKKKRCREKLQFESHLVFFSGAGRTRKVLSACVFPGGGSRSCEPSQIA